MSVPPPFLVRSAQRVPTLLGLRQLTSCATPQRLPTEVHLTRLSDLRIAFKWQIAHVPAR